MNHRDTIKYIKYRLKSLFDKELVSMEHYIAIDLNKKYKLKNPALHELCLINTVEKLNKILSLETSEYRNNIEDNYTLALDNNYFIDTIFIDESKRILPIKVINTNKLNNKDTYKIHILDIHKNDYTGYILYEVIDGDM